MVAPVVASRQRGTLRSALGDEQPARQAGTGCARVGLLLTMGFIVLVTMSVGAIVLLLTPLTFTAAGCGDRRAVRACSCPTSPWCSMEYHAVLMAAHAAEDAPAAVPVTAPA